MKTLYHKDRKEFSARAHAAAETTFYPNLFRQHRDAIKFIETDVRMGGVYGLLDAHMGVDYVAQLSVAGFKSHLPFTIQERWRPPEFEEHQDITVTEWNHASNEPSEIHKLLAHLFVYGYYDDSLNEIVEAYAINVLDFMLGIERGDIQYSRTDTPKRQTFIAVRFSEILAKRVHVYHYIDPYVGKDRKARERVSESIASAEEIWRSRVNNNQKGQPCR